MFCRAMCCGLLVGFAIAAADLPSFDIASVRPGSHPVSKVDRIDPTRFRAVSATLAELIEYAWRVPQDRISGPEDLKSTEHTFDIDATMPGSTTDEQSRLMLRHLLAERFSLALHTSMTPKSGYALVVAEDGPRLKASALETAVGIRVSQDQADATLRTSAASMSQFAGILSLILETRVEDRTHLAGLFEINATFSKLGPDETDASTVFDAMKRLGLRLDKAELPVAAIVVDQVHFKPIAN